MSDIHSWLAPAFLPQFPSPFPLHSSVFQPLKSCPTLLPHGLQHARLLCLSLSPGVCSNPCSLWCHPTISSSVIPFSSCPESYPASGYFPMNQLFASGGQSIAASTSTSVLPMNIQDWFPLELTGWISLLSKGLSRVFSNTTVRKHQFFNAQAFLWSSSHSVHDYWENQSFYYMHLCQQVTSLLFNTLSRFFIAFLPRSKHLNFMAVVTICSDFGTQKNKVSHCFHCVPICLPWSDGTTCHDLHFLNVEF